MSYPAPSPPPRPGPLPDLYRQWTVVRRLCRAVAIVLMVWGAVSFVSLIITVSHPTLSDFSTEFDQFLSIALIVAFVAISGILFASLSTIGTGYPPIGPENRSWGLVITSVVLFSVELALACLGRMGVEEALETRDRSLFDNVVSTEQNYAALESLGAWLVMFIVLSGAALSLSIVTLVRFSSVRNRQRRQAIMYSPSGSPVTPLVQPGPLTPPPSGGLPSPPSPVLTAEVELDQTLNRLERLRDLLNDGTLSRLEYDRLRSHIPGIQNAGFAPASEGLDGDDEGSSQKQ